MMRKAKRFVTYYLYFAATFGGLAWGSYFIFDAFYLNDKELMSEQGDYKK